QVRFVDVAGGDTVAVRFDRPPNLAPAPAAVAFAAAPAAAPAPAPAVVAGTVLARPGAPAPARPARATSALVASWVATGVLGAGTGVSGALALSASHDLEQQRSQYPANYNELQSAQSDAHRWSLISDGLLIGTVVAAAVSAYLTLTR